MSLASIDHHLSHAFNNANLDIDEGNALILLAAQELSSLTALADKLKVSESTLLEWLDSSAPKIPKRIINNLEKRLKLDGSVNPLILLAIGGLEPFQQWKNLTTLLIFDWIDDSLYHFSPILLSQHTSFICNQSLEIFLNSGMRFTSDIDIHVEGTEDINRLLDNNHYATVLYDLIENLIFLTDYYYCFFHDINSQIEKEDDRFSGLGMLIDLAAYHGLKSVEMFPELKAFKQNVEQFTYSHIDILKSYAYHHRLPIRTEPLALLDTDPTKLSELGMLHLSGATPPPLHPDIYINETLENQRLMQAVLPTICRKIGMSEEELETLLSLKPQKPISDLKH